MLKITKMMIKTTERIKLTEDLYYWCYNKPTIRFQKGKTYVFPYSIAKSIINQRIGYRDNGIKA